MIHVLAEILCNIKCYPNQIILPGAIARSDARARPPGVRTVADSILMSILSFRFGHENISTTILSLPLIQEGQLSVTDERSGT